MKNISSLLFPLAILIIGCSQEELQNPEIDSQGGRIFTAAFEQNETRTYVEDGNLLRWNAGDQISLFDGNTLNRQYQFDGETGDNAGTFSIVNSPYGSSNDLTANYGVYPYASDAKITESGVISTTLPADQNYAENSFGLGANTMVAVTEDPDDTFLKFKNVGGYLKLQLYGDDVKIKSIALTGNSNEKIAGKATIMSTYSDEPKISMSDDATSSITLNCGEGVKIGSTAETSTAFWIVVPPTTFESGFTITITDIGGGEMTKSTSNEISIERNIIKPMTAFEVETVETIPNNQIWYTSIDGNIVTPYQARPAWGIDIISNEYKNGKGIITFDGIVTDILNKAFYQCTSLSSVTIPNSVTKIESYAFYGCTSMTSVIIPDSVTEIGNQVFRETALTNVEIPNSVTSLGDAFNNCLSLITVSLPDGLTEIPSQLFYNCKSLTDLIIPEGITKIGQSAFYGCSSLTAISIPNSVTTIQKYAFAATGIINFTFPNKITNIAAYSVYNCSALESITIPKSVKTIEGSAFSANSKLKTVRIYAVTPPTITNTSMYGNAIFSGNTLTTCVLEVPTGCSTNYYNATGWAFSTIREIL